MIRLNTQNLDPEVVRGIQYTLDEDNIDRLRGEARDVLSLALKLKTRYATNPRAALTAERIAERAKRQLGTRLPRGVALTHRLNSFEHARLRLARAVERTSR